MFIINMLCEAVSNLLNFLFSVCIDSIRSHVKQLTYAIQISVKTLLDAQ